MLVCGVDKKEMYHCSYDMKCRLAETCIEPQDSYNVWGIFLLDNTVDGSPIFHQEMVGVKANPTNSSFYWMIVGSVYCINEYNNIKEKKTNAEMTKQPLLIAVIVLVIIVVGLLIAIVSICFFFKRRNVKNGQNIAEQDTML